MEEMSLSSVSRKLNKLYNDRDYILDRIEKILGLVTPKSGNMQDLLVDGGEKIDKLLRYTELKDELILIERLKYIEDKIKFLEEWRDLELERLNKYDELVQKVVHLKEEVYVKDKWTGKIRHMTMKEIAKECFISERSVYNKYKIGIETRNNKKQAIAS